MLRKIDLTSPIVQYSIGFFINVIYICVLMSVETSYANLQLPEGIYAENRWKSMDVQNYVRHARNFIAYGVFGDHMVPDNDRTIGYPAFLALMMTVFGEKWLFWTYFIQAIICASIYPALTIIANTVFPNNPRLIKFSFLFFLLAGTYYTTVPVILTDLFFTAFFVGGLCFGLLAIKKQNFLYALIQIFLIGYAAQVRPAIFLFPIVYVLVLVAIAKKYNVLKSHKTKLSILGSTMLLLILCNGPCIRNYINYGIFAPSVLLAMDGHFTYLAKWIMMDRNDLDLYDKMSKEVQRAETLEEGYELKRFYAREIYKRHPLTLLRFLFQNTVSNMGHSHLLNISLYWGYWWRDVPSMVHMPSQRSYFMLVLNIVFFLTYFAIYIFFFLFLFYLYRSKNYLYLFTAIALIAYFVLPASLAAAGARFRLPIEGFLVLMAFYEIDRKFGNKESVKGY
jgi:hypothetical protein